MLMVLMEQAVEVARTPVFEHTTLATHTQTTNIGNSNALAVTLDRDPEVGALLTVRIETTSEAGNGD